MNFKKGQVIKMIDGKFLGDTGFITEILDGNVCIMLSNGIEMLVNINNIEKADVRKAMKGFAFTETSNRVLNNNKLYQVMEANNFYALHVSSVKTGNVLPSRFRLFLSQEEPMEIINSLK